MVFTALNAFPQITPTSNPGFAPKVDVAGNGRTPVVHIKAPSSGGVSHNRYESFNVGADGVILNNSTSGGQSRIGGRVGANPHLNGTAARVIVNEVERGGSRSQLNGALEVFGAAADVIVANPSGVSVNGGRFINTPRVTLTTGQVSVNQAGQVELDVEEGEVAIEENGMDASNVGEVNLVGKRVKIAGKTKARDHLEVIAGASRYNHTTRESVSTGARSDGSYLIDAHELGAMEAGKIYLRVTEEGAGVRAPTNMAASADDITITADGDVIIGRPGSKHTAAKGMSVTSKSGKVTHAGETRVKGRAELKGKAVKVESESIIGSENFVLIEAPQIEVEKRGWLDSRGSIELNGPGSEAQIRMDGAVNADSDFMVSGEGSYIQHGSVQAGRDALFNVPSVSMPVSQRNVDAVGDIIGNVTQWESKGELDAHRSIFLSGDTLKVAGNLKAREQLSFKASKQVTNEGELGAPEISFLGEAPLYNINGGSIIARPGSAPKVHLPSGGLNNDRGNFYWGGDLS